MNSLPKTVARQRRDYDLNLGPSAPESRSLTTRLPSHPLCICTVLYVLRFCAELAGLRRILSSIDQMAQKWKTFADVFRQLLPSSTLTTPASSANGPKINYILRGNLRMIQLGLSAGPEPKIPTFFHYR